MNKFKHIFSGIILTSLIISINTTCRMNDCTQEEINAGTCSISYKEISGTSGVPTTVDANELEPNDNYYQANSLLQSIKNDKSFDPNDKTFARTGIINTEVDEDWYKIELKGEDFDKISASKTNCDDTTGYSNCYDSTNNAPYQNNYPDHKEIVLNGSGSYFLKPRFIVRVESEDGQDMGLRVQIYPPGLTINYGGTLTKKSISDSYDVVLNTKNALTPLQEDPCTLPSCDPTKDGGPLRITNLSSPLLTMFPVSWEHLVRVDETDQYNTFYHSCYVSSIVQNPTARKEYKQMNYQMLVKKDLNGFRTLDSYSVGTYYVRVTSNATYKNRKYKIYWYWNTGDVSKGGVNEYSLRAGGTLDTLKYSYSPDTTQTMGLTGSDAVPGFFCDKANVDTYYYTGKKPFCRTIAPITCADGEATGVEIFCYNRHNVTGKQIAQGHTTVCSAGSTGTASYCLEDSYGICEGDMNGDGIASSTVEDLGCYFNRGECQIQDKGSYDENKIVGGEKARIHDCRQACY